MELSKVLTILIQATLITLIYLFLYLTAKLFWWTGNCTDTSKSITTRKLLLCGDDITTALSGSRLSREEYDWCVWSNSVSGGNVSPKTLWGKLNSASDRLKYQSLQCNQLRDSQESCDDIEGDIHIKRWRQSGVFANKLKCDGRSKVNCYHNNSDLFCEVRHVSIDFSKYHNSSRVNRFGETLKLRSFEKDFIQSDCVLDENRAAEVQSVLPIGDMYSPQLSSDRCDITLKGPVLLYSHDYLENYGHTLNDIMNVWRVLWLSGLAASTSSVTLLSVDGLYGSRSYNDRPNPWFRHYKQHFGRVLMGSDFVNKTVCIDRLLIQPLPGTFFVFKYWHADDKCNLMGPSSLFQRYNLHVRGLFTSDGAAAATAVSGTVPGDVRGSNGEFRIVVIVRRETDNLGGTSSKTSRLMLNLDQVKATMKETSTHIRSVVGDDTDVDVVFQDLRLLSYERQLQLIGRTNILVGMHGAGIPQSLHMSIGTLDKCCGVIEMFPAGEFSIIRAHGNMARRMGLRYDRIDISANESHSHGASVPVQELASKVVKMAALLKSKPTCILPSVLRDPYLS